MASDTYTVSKPHSWDKAVFAAYLRMVGYTQEEAAKIAGVGARTLARWEVSDFWDDAQDEAAEDRWLRHLVHMARRGVTIGVLTDGNLALKVLERTDDRLSPPAHRHEVGGPGGGPIEVSVKRKVVGTKNRLESYTSANGASGNGKP